MRPLVSFVYQYGVHFKVLRDLLGHGGGERAQVRRGGESTSSRCLQAMAAVGRRAWSPGATNRSGDDGLLHASQIEALLARTASEDEAPRQQALQELQVEMRGDRQPKRAAAARAAARRAGRRGRSGSSVEAGRAGRRRE